MRSGKGVEIGTHLRLKPLALPLSGLPFPHLYLTFHKHMNKKVPTSFLQKRNLTLQPPAGVAGVLPLWDVMAGIANASPWPAHFPGVRLALGCELPRCMSPSYFSLHSNEKHCPSSQVAVIRSTLSFMVGPLSLAGAWQRLSTPLFAPSSRNSLFFSSNQLFRAAQTKKLSRGCEIPSPYNWG